MLRIVTPELFARDLGAELTTPHELRAFKAYEAAEIRPLLKDADVLVCSMYRAEWGGRELPLKLIHSSGAGIDGIELAGVPAGCAVCNVYGHEYTVAEYVFMTMAALNRRLLPQDHGLRQGHWGDRQPTRELRGRTLLIVGLGHIGAEVARWAHFFEMRVIGVTRAPSAERAREHGLAALGGPEDLARYLPEADFLVLALPTTAATKGMIGERELGSMKPTSYLVNVGRAPLVDEEALYRALKDGAIAGAALDVWYHYPTGTEARLPSTQPFHELENVIMTPHNAGYSDGTMRYRWRFIAENLARLAAGEPLQNVVKAAE